MSTKLRPGAAREAGMDAKRVGHIRDLSHGWVEEGITPSLVVLAARRGVIILHEAYGVMGPEPDAGPLQKETIFPIASISKPITATALMCLVEDGLVGLNRPVQWYIPEFVGQGKDAVMVHHLLTHTSGVTDEALDRLATGDWRDMKMLARAIPEHVWINELLHLGYELPLAHTPGTAMATSSYGYELLGEIVRRVSGQSLAAFAAERVLSPLGMADTYWPVPGSSALRVVRRGDDTTRAEFLRTFALAGIAWAFGGVSSCATDLAAFGQMLLNGGSYGDATVLSRPSVEAMTRNQIPETSAKFLGEHFPEASWGLGWSITGTKRCLAYGEPLMSSRAFCHSGAGGAFMWVDPEHELVGVYLSVLSDRGTPQGLLCPKVASYVKVGSISTSMLSPRPS